MDAFLKTSEPGEQPRAASQATLDRIRRVFVEALHLNLRPEEVDFARKLDEFAGLDSLAVLEFVTALEREFAIIIDPELLRLDFVRDLSQLACYMEERTAQVPQPPRA